jgi:hypothetical protein
MKTILNIFLIISIVLFTFGFAQAEFEVYDANGILIGYSANGPELSVTSPPAIFIPDISMFVSLGSQGNPTVLADLLYENNNCTGNAYVERWFVESMPNYINFIFSFENTAYTLGSDQLYSFFIYSYKFDGYPCITPAEDLSLPFSLNVVPVQQITTPFTLPVATPLKFKMINKMKTK